MSKAIPFTFGRTNHMSEIRPLGDAYTTEAMREARDIGLDQIDARLSTLSQNDDIESFEKVVYLTMLRDIVS